MLLLLLLHPPELCSNDVAACQPVDRGSPELLLLPLSRVLRLHHRRPGLRVRRGPRPAERCVVRSRHLRTILERLPELHDGRRRHHHRRSPLRHQGRVKVEVYWSLSWVTGHFPRQVVSPTRRFPDRTIFRQVFYPTYIINDSIGETCRGNVLSEKRPVRETSSNLLIVAIRLYWFDEYPYTTICLQSTGR